MNMFDWDAQRKKGGRRFLRRQFLTFSLVGGAGFWGHQRWLGRAQALIQRPHSFLTPTDDFYSVGIKPGYDPQIDLESWRLEVEGPSGKSYHWTFSQLAALPSYQTHRTLICIENPVGGGAISNARWKVTSLAGLIEPMLRGTSGIQEVVFYGMDGFHSSVPLEVALDRESVVAYQMNGQPLPIRHGFPARVLLPDRYGMKQPRWLNRISLSSGRHWGYWERRGWSHAGTIQLISRIDRMDRVGDTISLRGVSFAGSRVIAGVQVTVDDGESWQPARLSSTASPNAWVTWEFTGRPVVGGPKPPVFKTRARTAAGERQSEWYRSSFPWGSTGLHRVWLPTSIGEEMHQHLVG